MGAGLGGTALLNPPTLPSLLCFPNKGPCVPRLARDHLGARNRTADFQDQVFGTGVCRKLARQRRAAGNGSTSLVVSLRRPERSQASTEDALRRGETGAQSKRQNRPRATGLGRQYIVGSVVRSLAQQDGNWTRTRCRLAD